MKRFFVSLVGAFGVLVLGAGGLLPSVPMAHELRAEPALANSGWKFPFPSGDSYYQYRTTEPHSTGNSGLDLTPRTAGRTGAVLAPFSGRVTFAGRSGSFYCSALRRTVSNPYVAVRDSSSGKTIELHHLSRIDVRSGQNVTRGQRLGTSGREGCATGVHIHMTLRASNGAHLSWVGQTIDGWRFRNQRGQTFRSTNGTPSQPPRNVTFSRDATSRLYVTSDGQEIRLHLCANSIVGQRVVARLSRPAVPGAPARSWTYEKRATTRCVLFRDMEGPGGVLRNVTYTSRAAQNQSPSTSWSGSGCYASTGGQGLCDQTRR